MKLGRIHAQLFGYPIQMLHPTGTHAPKDAAMVRTFRYRIGKHEAALVTRAINFIEPVKVRRWQPENHGPFIVRARIKGDIRLQSLDRAIFSHARAKLVQRVAGTAKHDEFFIAGRFDFHGLTGLT